MKATAGEKINFRMVRSNAVHSGYVVKPACDSKTGGHWYCAIHQEHAQNNFERHDGPKCKQVWICHEHGPEQP